MASCIFCQWENDDDNVVVKGKHLVAIADKYPVTKGHHLILPRKHRDDFFELTKDELAELGDFVREVRDHLKKSDSSIEGFNIGANCGPVAGQTVMHAHIHLIPRRKGDTTTSADGGVRGVIPGKQKYNP